jgi:HPt (histidine-containing phosphotransfer) domain-containing protein
MTGSTSSEPALDLHHLTTHTFGDRALERELLELFEQQCKRLVPVLASTSAVGGRDEAAHTLKGAARAVGASRIAAIAGCFESAVGRGSDEARLLQLAADLRAAADETMTAIALRQVQP